MWVEGNNLKTPDLADVLHHCSEGDSSNAQGPSSGECKVLAFCMQRLEFFELLGLSCSLFVVDF